MKIYSQNRGRYISLHKDCRVMVTSTGFETVSMRWKGNPPPGSVPYFLWRVEWDLLLFLYWKNNHLRVSPGLPVIIERLHVFSNTMESIFGRCRLNTCIRAVSQRQDMPLTTLLKAYRVTELVSKESNLGDWSCFQPLEDEASSRNRTLLIL